MSKLIFPIIRLGQQGEYYKNIYRHDFLNYVL